MRVDENWAEEIGAFYTEMHAIFFHASYITCTSKVGGVKMGKSLLQIIY
jgi:hypothetical protein